MLEASPDRGLARRIRNWWTSHIIGAKNGNVVRQRQQPPMMANTTASESQRDQTALPSKNWICSNRHHAPLVADCEFSAATKSSGSGGIHEATSTRSQFSAYPNFARVLQSRSESALAVHTRKKHTPRILSWVSLCRAAGFGAHALLQTRNIQSALTLLNTFKKSQRTIGRRSRRHPIGWR